MDFIVAEENALNIQKKPLSEKDFKWSFPPVSGKEYILSVDIPSSVHSFTFHIPSPTVGARLSLYLGSSEVDFLRIRPLNP